MVHQQVTDGGGRSYDELDRLVRGVGQVCIAASGLEAEVAFLCLTLDHWSDEKFRKVMRTTGGALREYALLVPRLEAFGLGPDPRSLLDQAQKLMRERNRVVHSVMMIETRTSEHRYEAWDAKSDDTRDVNPADLHDLAENLIQLTAEAEGFIRAWEERAERDGWPLIPSVSDEKNAASTSIGRLTHVAGLDGDRPCGDSTETERMIRHGS